MRLPQSEARIRQFPDSIQAFGDYYTQGRQDKHSWLCVKMRVSLFIFVKHDMTQILTPCMYSYTTSKHPLFPTTELLSLSQSIVALSYPLPFSVFALFTSLPNS